MPQRSPGEQRTRKGERTRARILEAALELFEERGYEGTSMRAVAQRAGVAVGNAYYYFASKEHLVQGFYWRMHADALAATERVLARETTLEARLGGVLHEHLSAAEPYHRFAGILFRTAADPDSPLNPFSAESRELREQATDLLARALAGSRTRVPADLAGELPELLWLHHMGVILFWIHDDSPGRERSRVLIDRTVQLVARLIRLAGNPLMRPLRKEVLRLLGELRLPAAAAGEDESVGVQDP